MLFPIIAPDVRTTTTYRKKFTSQIRHGKQGFQKFYTNPASIPGLTGKESAHVPHTRYAGSWKDHKYSGDGVYLKIQSASSKDPSKLVDVEKPGVPQFPASISQLDSSNCQFEREVVVYDGCFEDGKRQGKGIAFLRKPVPGAPDQLYRFNGVFVKDQPFFGELTHIDPNPPKKGTGYVKYYVGMVHALGKDHGHGKQIASSALHEVSPFELFAAANIALESNGMSPAQLL